MKQFNRVITIEQDVDVIANELLNSFAPDFKHREQVCEAVIATALEKNTLGYVYNALAGFSNDINFQEGESVICSEDVYSYVLKAKDGEDDADVWEERRVKMGTCLIEEINPYSKEKLRVKYIVNTRDGKPAEREKWVSHWKCAKIAVPEEVVQTVTVDTVPYVEEKQLAH